MTSNVVFSVRYRLTCDHNNSAGRAEQSGADDAGPWTLKWTEEEVRRPEWSGRLRGARVWRWCVDGDNWGLLIASYIFIAHLLSATPCLRSVRRRFVINSLHTAVICIPLPGNRLRATGNPHLGPPGDANDGNSVRSLNTSNQLCNCCGVQPSIQQNTISQQPPRHYHCTRHMLLR